jgi:hypothetical protein
MCKNEAARSRERCWRDSTDVCALSDGERHLGHIVLIGMNWNAFDAVHLNDNRNGFKYLGTFPSIAAAKAVVEVSIARRDDSNFLSANGGEKPEGVWIS